MILDFSYEKLKMLFEITDDNKIYLRHFSNKDFEDREKKLICNNICDVHISGENPDGHHGAKHNCSSCNNTLEYVSHIETINDYGKKIEFLLRNEKIEVKKHYQFYEGISGVRAWSEVKNISDYAVGLEYVSSFGYTGIDEEDIKVLIPHNSWVREVNWQEYSLMDAGLARITQSSTKRISVSNTGAWSAKEYLPMGATVQKDTAMMWQIENNGSWQWEIGDADDMLYLKLSGPTEQENGWYKNLLPGDEFESVKAFICVGDDFCDTLSQMTKYRKKIAARNAPEKKLPVIFNDYMHCLWADPTYEKSIPLIDLAAEVGAEYYCMDAGWYAEGKWWDSVGEWLPQEKRFPGGIKKVFDYIKSKGMVPGIWLEIEVMGINSPKRNDFEDECYFMRHGKKVIDHGRYQLDFTNKKVREFATSVVDRVANEFGVGYIKFDYNIEPGIGTEVNSDSYGDGLLKHNMAVLSWVDEIKEKYPDLILENCSSGGLRMDYAMLSHYHLQSVTDQEDYINLAHIAAGAPTAVLPEQSAVWVYPKEEDDLNAISFKFTSAMLQRVHLSGEIQKLSKEQLNVVKAGVECYKKLRQDIPDALPYYPLGVPKYSDKVSCLALEKGDITRICVWCFDEKQKVTIPVAGNDVKVLYPAENSIKTEIVPDGISVEFEKPHTAAVIEIERK